MKKISNNPFDELVTGLRDRGVDDGEIQGYLEDVVSKFEEFDIEYDDGSIKNAESEDEEMGYMWRSATVKFIDGHHLSDPQDKEQSFPYARLTSEGWLEWKCENSDIYCAPSSQIEFVCWKE